MLFMEVQIHTCYSHIFTFMSEQLHWLPLSVCIKFKILILVSRAKQDLSPKYPADLINWPLSVSLRRPLCSLNELDLLVPHIKKAVSHSRLVLHTVAILHRG